MRGQLRAPLVADKPSAVCAVSMWDYLIPAAIGGGAGLASGFAARYMFRNEHPTTADAAAHIVEGAVTLLVGGLTFIIRLSRPR